MEENIVGVERPTGAEVYPQLSVVLAPLNIYGI